MPISIRVTGLTEARSALIRLPKKIERDAILQMSQVAYDAVQRGADRHTKTGALFQSVYNRQTAAGGREIGHDPQRAPHAAFVVFGTRPHDIRPRNRRALRWANNGRFVFSKFVRHPGYAGDDYMTTAARDALDRLRQIISNIELFT